MEISRPPFPAPVLCIDDFLKADEADAILRESQDLRRVYMPARVFDGPNATREDPTVRSNEVVYLDDVFRGAPERSDILRILKRRIWDDDCRALWHDGYSLLDVINYATWHEIVLSRYGDSTFYGPHQDTRFDRITARLVTLVYYVNATPAGFDGGELTLWEGAERMALQPRHNRAIVFPSFVSHEVAPVRMTGSRWEDGRFSVNYWLGFN